MTNKEAIEWLEKEIKFRHNLKVSPLLAGKPDTEEEVYRAAVEALKFKEEYVTKVQKCIDRIEKECKEVMRECDCEPVYVHMMQIIWEELC